MDTYSVEPVPGKEDLNYAGATGTLFTVNCTKKKPFEIYKYGEGKNGNNPLAGAGFMACNVNDLSKDTRGNYIWDSHKIYLTEKKNIY